jgi:hypothetical protein
MSSQQAIRSPDRELATGSFTGWPPEETSLGHLQRPREVFESCYRRVLLASLEFRRIPVRKPCKVIQVTLRQPSPPSVALNIVANSLEKRRAGLVLCFPRALGKVAGTHFAKYSDDTPSLPPSGATYLGEASTASPDTARYRRRRMRLVHTQGFPVQKERTTGLNPELIATIYGGLTIYAPPTDQFVRPLYGATVAVGMRRPSIPYTRSYDPLTEIDFSGLPCEKQ